MTTDAPPRKAPLALWRAAREFIVTFFNLFGAPEQIAADHTLSAKTHALLLSWLRVGEAFLRQLLVIEAVAYASDTPPPSRRHAAQRKPRQRQRVEFFADKPEDWRVSFRVFAQPDRRLSSAEASAKADPAGKRVQPSQTSKTETPCRLDVGAPRRFYSAWPLAERAEALLRAFNDPTPYAKRIARRLHAKPDLKRTLTKQPEHFVERIGDDHTSLLARLFEQSQLTVTDSSGAPALRRRIEFDPIGERLREFLE